MRRSTGMSGGRMLRAVGRAVGSGAKDAAAAVGSVGLAGRPPPRVVCLSSSSSSSSDSSGNKTSPTSSPSFASASASKAKEAASERTAAGWDSHYTLLGDGEDWESVGAEELGEGEGIDRLVFGAAPTKEEAEDAVSMLQQIFVPVTVSQVLDDGFPPHVLSNTVDKGNIPSDFSQKVSSTEFSSESESDWIEPVMHVYTSSCPSREHEKVFDAFRVLEMNPSLKRMVVSLSSDNAVWDAVMKNEVVQELKKSAFEVKENENESDDSDENRNIPGGVLGWFFASLKAKFTEFVDKIMRLVNETFRSQENKNTDTFDEAVKTSFMLSVMVFIVVVMARVSKA